MDNNENLFLDVWYWVPSLACLGQVTDKNIPGSPFLRKIQIYNFFLFQYKVLHLYYPISLKSQVFESKGPRVGTSTQRPNRYRRKYVGVIVSTHNTVSGIPGVWSL